MEKACGRTTVGCIHNPQGQGKSSSNGGGDVSHWATRLPNSALGEQKGKEAEGHLLTVFKYLMDMQIRLSFIMLHILDNPWIFLNVRP